MKRGLLCLVVMLCTVTLVRADQAIRSLQQTLKERGFYYGVVTGDKSAETTAAIRRYQIRNGLKVTGEINEETLRSVNSNAVASASRPASKPATIQRNSVRPEASARLSQSSPSPSFRQPDRPVETNPPYSASFYQSGPLWVNRQSIIAGAQYQLMHRGYYRGRVDGKYGSQTAFAVRAFQLSAGLPPTGRLDIATINALGSSGTEFADSAPASRGDETWIPVTKFKHGRWKVKWKKYHRSWAARTATKIDRQIVTTCGTLTMRTSKSVRSIAIRGVACAASAHSPSDAHLIPLKTADTTAVRLVSSCAPDLRRRLWRGAQRTIFGNDRRTHPEN
jgi:peptidoglycan hydrolase-like protein with peptidoglycan-binding domain